MESIIKSDVFFFVSSIGFIVVTVLLVVILSYIIFIMRKVKQVVETVQDTTKHLAGKINSVEDILENSFVMKAVGLFFTRATKEKKPRVKSVSKEV